MIPDCGVVNPYQAGAVRGGDKSDLEALQACIDHIAWLNTHHTLDNAYGYDSSQTSVKLVIPANRTFLVNAGSGSPPVRLQLRGPITIEGEDRFTSRIRLVESVPESSSGDVFDQVGGAETVDGATCLFLAKNLNPVALNPTTPARGVRLAFRNFMMEGSYGPKDTVNTYDTIHGGAQLLKFLNVDELLFDQMVFSRNRAVVLGGDGVRKLTMRGCLMSESRRGGLVINDVENLEVEDNDFRWVSDDPVAVTIGGASGVDTYRKVGGPIRIVGNRVFGCRGLNVVGGKNVLIADNTSILCRGRAIHVGATTFEDKHDTTTLNVIVRGNIITDLLDAAVDPELEATNGGHRAIDVELIYAAPGALTSVPGLPASPSGTIVDPAQYYYTADQGLQGIRLWKKAKSVPATTDPMNPTQTWWDGRIYKTDNGGTSGNAPPTGTGANISDKGTDPDHAGVI